MRGTIAAAALLAVVGTAVFLVLRTGERDAASVAVPPPVVDARARAGPTAPDTLDDRTPAVDPARRAERDGDAFRAVVLPPAGTPVKALLAQLRPAAELGHAPSSCRLGMELATCRTARYAVKQGGSPADFAEALGMCEGVPDVDIAQAWRFLFNSAQAGNVAAMSKFARDPGLSIDDLAASAEGWAAYRDHAQRFFWGAIQGGDVMALFSNWFALMSGLTVGGKGVIERDPYQALVYGTAAIPLLDPRRQALVVRVNARLAQELKPELVVQANAEGERLRARYFSAAAPALDTLEDGYVVVEDCAR